MIVRVDLGLELDRRFVAEGAVFAVVVVVGFDEIEILMTEGP